MDFLRIMSFSDIALNASIPLLGHIVFKCPDDKHWIHLCHPIYVGNSQELGEGDICHTCKC